MSTPETPWWSVQAGEYVLGTLRGEDLAFFERVLRHDREIQADVARWERQLGPLAETVRAHPPARHVWPDLLERIRNPDATPLDDASADAAERVVAVDRVVDPGGGERQASGRTRRIGGETTDAPPSADVVPMRRSRDERRDRTSEDGGRVRLWQTVAGLATAASLVLGTLVGVLLYQRAELPAFAPLDVDGLAVVLSDADGEPYFLVETDYGNLRVRVTALSPPALEEERNFQLWQALPDRSSVRPVALLPTETGRSQVFDVGSLIEGSDLFGVSIEPEGAPTDGGPTGPVVAHGDFLPRTEDEARR